MAEIVVAIDRVLSSGSSFPSLVTTEAGGRYVLKLSGAGPGKRSLATQFVALKLARRLGLKAPDAAVLELPRSLPWQAGTDEFYEAVQRSAGSNLGVAFVADAADVTVADLGGLPVGFVDRIATADALLQNVDRTRANPNILRDATGAHWAIDFGACLLLDRLARGALAPRTELPPKHFLAGSDVTDAVRTAAEQVDAAFLEPVMAALPGDWLADFGLSRQALLQRLVGYLEAVRAAGPG
jgi:hypothetical protein